MIGKRNRNYDRVMSRVRDRSRSSLASSSYVTRHENPSSVRIGAKASHSNLSSGVISELPIVLDDYVPESSREKEVKKSNVVKPRRTVKSLDPGKSPPGALAAARESRAKARKLTSERSVPSLVLGKSDGWSDTHVRQCYSSRTHSKLRELKDEIKVYNEREKLLRLRSELYKKCGVVLDDVGGVAVDKGVQAETAGTDSEAHTKRRKKWLELIDRPDLITSKTKAKSHRVCSLHFDKSKMKYIPHLKSDALPTKLLPNQQNAADDTDENNKDKSTQTNESFGKILLAVTIEGPPDSKVLSVQTALENVQTDTTQTRMALSSETPKKPKLQDNFRVGKKKKKAAE